MSSEYRFNTKQQEIRELKQELRSLSEQLAYHYKSIDYYSIAIYNTTQDINNDESIDIDIYKVLIRQIQHTAKSTIKRIRMKELRLIQLRST